MPRGSLQDLLDSKSSSAELHWGDPLLRLATDTARGMAYLHSVRRSTDDASDDDDGGGGGLGFGRRLNQQQLHCIVHRDLKPENVLVRLRLNSSPEIDPS